MTKTITNYFPVIARSLPKTFGDDEAISLIKTIKSIALYVF
jgi:hypothetical protein